MMLKRQDEAAKPVEQEIAELQRKFRVLENDKRACTEDSQGVIRKQRATIEKLKREGQKMKVELQESSSSAGNQAENRLALETIQKLTEQREHLKVRLQTEMELERSLQDTLDSTNKQIFALRGDMAKNGGVNAACDNTKAVQKQIRVLENRLDKALQKFNEAINGNKELREQIDTLRRERLVFDDIYRRLENELAHKKKEMANIIEQANAAYEARDQAQSQMAQLKQQADREHVEFEKEWKELGKLIQNDKKMKEFMKTRVKGLREATQHESAAGNNNTSKESTLLLHRAGAQQDATSQPSSDTAESLKAKVSTFEGAFERIQLATGVCDLEELVQRFIHSEDQNFSLFKYNTELTEEIEQLEQQIVVSKEELVHLSGSSTKKEDTEKAKLVESLEEKWNDMDKKALYFEERDQETQQTLSHIRSGTENIFRRLGCCADEGSGLGGDITEANMLQYLAAIEHRINVLLKKYNSQHEGDGEGFVATVKSSRNQSVMANLQVKLPSTVEDPSDDENEDEDEDSRPLTVEELKEKTMKKARQQVAAKSTKCKGALGR